MAVKYSDEQLLEIRSLLDLSCCYADVLTKLVKESGLEKVRGFSLTICVEPQLESRAAEVSLGYDIGMDAGHIRLTKGEGDEHYVPTDKCSPEYQCLFIPTDIAERMRKVLGRENAAGIGGGGGSDRCDSGSVVRGV